MTVERRTSTVTHWPTTRAAEFHASSTTGRHARTCHPARLRRGQQFNKGSSTTWVIPKIQDGQDGQFQKSMVFRPGFQGLWYRQILGSTFQATPMSWANSSSSSRTSLAGSGLVHCLAPQLGLGVRSWGPFLGIETSMVSKPIGLSWFMQVSSLKSQINHGLSWF